MDHKKQILLRKQSIKRKHPKKGVGIFLYSDNIINNMAPKDNIVGWYPKKKPAQQETKHYDIKNVGVYKDKKGKTKSIW